ncbi:MAG: hypothetical protein J6N78_04140 [Clostridia bacterium]|nr:hypothetical protein [Clostridia bacterium]
MENKSYIKLFRKLLQSPIWKNEKALKIWLWCLLKATHIERNQLVGHTIVHLEKGQFVFGRNSASDELDMKESTVYKYIKLLEKLQMISIKSNNKFSVVSIEKWEEYQIEELKNNNNITTTEQQSNTNKNVKNIYINLFNKYKAEIEKENSREKIHIIAKCKECEEYAQLTPEEQDQLFYDLMSIDKKFK